MLYLILADGSLTELAGATHAYLSDDGELLCCARNGATVARYPKLAVLAFSEKPFPTGEVDSAVERAERHPQSD